jgi:hypothetical protein
LTKLVVAVLLIAILVVGCVPKKGGGFSCISLPFGKTKPATESTPVTPPPAGTQGKTTQQSANKDTATVDSTSDFEADFTTPPPR